MGVKNAAVRKLDQELGIKDFPIEALNFLTKIHYESCSDDIWGEHEIDHILVAQVDVPLNPNPNEVRDTRYFTKEQLQTFIDTHEQNGIKLTPWFSLITGKFLYKWWDNLQSLDQFA
eukprot:CAMPEP_0168515224 /NCGR_PEP_ID=MMETSP0405-20121227/4614_1 /TAXON_ID=498012 /ORGANISM="Trichosphaerium sp, Strain Am-I-7 wt" /LENGTH=116 /DNA_ID=CAMNT_0008534573 /DNA_START=84 /DNA_END=431 /DNA_ORIENTATION=-